MTESPASRVAAILAVTAVTAWGFVGALAPRPGFTDALFEPDYTIRFAPEGGPLDEAGFQPGDSVISVAGIPVVELGMYSRWPRSLSRQPGEALRMVVERDGERYEGAVVFREPPGSPGLRLRVLAVGLSFLWFGLWAFLTTPSPHSTTLLIMGLALGLGMPAPEMWTWNGVRDHLQVAGTTLWALLLLRFFLFFPEPKRVTRRRGVDLVLFAPWTVLLACLALELAFHPRFYHTFGGFAGLLLVAYLVLALVAVIHTVRRTPATRLRASGMGIILLGIAVALIPNLVTVAAWLIPPGFKVPGDEYYPLLAAVIPLSMALGVRRHARAAAPATTPPGPTPG